jgi:hypothetical protein
MTKFFNELLSLQNIIGCYINNEFPNAYCLLWNKEYNNALATEVPDLLMTEMRKVVETDGVADLAIH